jgi:hypothetical protein
MRTNAPTPELHRIAVLRRDEEISRVSRHRRQRNDKAPSRLSWFGGARTVIGRSLIATGRWIAPPKPSASGTRGPATA